MENEWVYAEVERKDAKHFYILEREDNSNMCVVFEVQIPLTNHIELYGKWDGMAAEVILEDLRQFMVIFPSYMKRICKEHNGICRISKFPNYSIGHIDYTPNHIMIGANGETLQIAGCDSKDVGEHFTEYFVKGLQGNWKGINFAECD